MPDSGSDLEGPGGARGSSEVKGDSEGGSEKKLFIVGIGPGHPDHMSVRAHRVLASVDAVAGYTTYIDLVREVIAGKKIIATGMKRELDRVEKALETAMTGETCAVISSGDAGVYAMAGLVFEMCRRKGIEIARPGEKKEKNSLIVEVVPGTPALCSAGALLGAPLTHDFAAVSLSDLLTPWETIKKRIAAAAAGDFVIVLYNPKSKKRTWQFSKALSIIRKHRAAETVAGVVRNAMRPKQQVSVTTLDALYNIEIDMQTTVFIGNSTTFCLNDFMITPRGYAAKYSLDGRG